MKPSAFNKKNTVQDWITKTRYKSGYEDQLRKPKAKPVKAPVATHVATKMTPKRKSSMIDLAKSEHQRTRRPYNIVRKASS